MSNMKQLIELIEECRESNMDYYRIINAIQQRFNVEFENAESLYNNYITHYTGSVNHEMLDVTKNNY